MKRPLIIILILISKFVFGQQVAENWFTYAGCCTENDVINRETEIRDTSEVIFTTKKSGDTLIITYSELNNNKYFIRKLTFKNDLNICDYDQFIIMCDRCTPLFVKEILGAKVYGWTKISDQLYFSKTKWMFELTLNSDIDNVCNSITYKKTKLKKKEFKMKIKEITTANRT